MEKIKWPLYVLVAGLLAAAPFLTTGPVGTSEAYNYSLSVADAVTQFRNGTVPVLAGQTEFAFNGRIHPLRTAPYLSYMAGLLDLLTFRQLGFWSLQNLVLALSLVGGALACYWGLRRVTAASPVIAGILSALYVLAPPVLAAAYGMDLYMTVTTVPFVPVVIAMGIASFTERRPGDLLKMVAALAACWLAHPPVAFWLSVTAAGLQIAAACARPPSWREWMMLLAMGLLFVVLAGFGFASALTISPYQQVTKAHDMSLLFTEVRRAFPDSLRPISRTASQLGDFQLGYVAWALAAGALGLAVVRRHWPALAVLGIAGLLFAMTAPIPGIHRWLWEHAPAAAFNLTNQWPMQRLYLIVTMLVLSAFALVWRAPTVRVAVVRDAIRLILAAAVVWSAWQSSRFILRGLAGQGGSETTRRGHASSNINLTPISYAVLGAPDSFSNGVTDPTFEFRLLAPYDAHEVASNWTAPLPPSPESRRGVFNLRAGDQPDILDFSPTLTLQPGARYRLTFNFLASPADAILQFRGPTLFRQYMLPQPGGDRGFGMLPGNNPRLTLWTAQSTPEEISLRAGGAGLANGPWANGRFAEFNFEKIDPAALPIDVQSVYPLRVRVRAASPGYLETPRMFIAGYRARVNGQPVRTQRSPDGFVMLAVPSGDSQVELEYVGPLVTRCAFWIGFVGWLALGLGSLAWVRWPAWPAAVGGRFKIRCTVWLTIGGAVLAAAAGIYAWQKWSAYRGAFGPVQVRFVLPRGETNRQQPLVVTGKHHAGLFVYAMYHDPKHIRIGVDVWGLLGYQTDPIRADYFAEHEVIVEAGSLYPAGHPGLRDIPEATLKELRQRLRVKFNGATVVDRNIDTYESTPRQVTIGRNLIGGSSCEPLFAGEILDARRLPVPR